MTASPIRLISVNVGLRREMRVGERALTTGIDKRPARGPVLCGPQGLAGDAVVDTRHHGGPDQAVYLYREEDYRWFSQRLGRGLEPGLFGENLTVAGLPADLRLGDRLRLGEVLLEMSGPRLPCATFAAHMGERDFVTTFGQARRPGYYARVLEGGPLRAGQTGEVLATGRGHPTVLELYDLWYADRRDPALLRRLLEAPVARRARTKIEGWLAGA